MILIDKEVVLESRIGFKEKPYLECKNPTYVIDVDEPIVIVPVVQYILKVREIDVPGRFGQASKKQQKFLEPFGQPVTCVFRLQTWFNNFATLPLDQYDQKFIQTIDFVNQKERNGTWTGNELQQISWWAKEEFGGVVGTDCKIITDQMLIDLDIIKIS